MKYVYKESKRTWISSTIKGGKCIVKQGCSYLPLCTLRSCVGPTAKKTHIGRSRHFVFRRQKTDRKCIWMGSECSYRRPTYQNFLGKVSPLIRWRISFLVHPLLASSVLVHAFGVRFLLSWFFWKMSHSILFHQYISIRNLFGKLRKFPSIWISRKFHFNGYYRIVPKALKRLSQFERKNIM